MSTTHSASTTPPPSSSADPSVLNKDQLLKLVEGFYPDVITRTQSGNGFKIRQTDTVLHKYSQHMIGKHVRLDTRHEKSTKARPFNSEVMQNYVDLGNCTYAVVNLGGPLGEALLSKYGVEMFANSAFGLDSRNADTDNLDDLEDDEGEDLKDEKEEAAKKKPLTWPTLPLGVHEAVYMGSRFVVLYQEIGDPQGKSYGDPSAPRTMVVFTDGRDNLEKIQKLGEYLIKKCADAPKKQSFHLYRWQHNCGYWKRISSEKARPMNSVIMPTGLRESVELDMKRFLSKKTRAWYDRRGIPYKRCYMFWGVPGTGKTSLITALAGRFRRNVCFLSAHHPKFTDEALKSALSRVPSRAIIVLEDIDSLFDKDRKTNNTNNPLTFTGLLNAVDGIGEHRGTIFVMTTNFIDRLDSALIRAGRVDMKVEFKHADDYQLSEYFKWFYDDNLEEATRLAPEWVKACRKQFPEGVTMAELQQHFVDNMYSDAETCISNLKFYDLPLLQKQAAAEEEMRKKEAEAKKKKEKEAKEAKNEKKDSEEAKDEEEDGDNAAK